MPVCALPSETVRALGSSQIIQSPLSVVKELIDNALDAHASSVFVDISLNSVDVVQVKDNGYGIAASDRRLVCRPHCTSKIQDFQDITTIGGSSLGFRGEALASIADISGSLTISTKAEGDSTAVSLKISRSGEVESEERTSHPIGTTVKVRDLFKTIPVRRQNALKSGQKTLIQIKSLLQGYALARPHVRFSLRVLKTKNDKSNWSYVPNTPATLLHVATQLYGRSVTDHLITVEWPDVEEVMKSQQSQTTDPPAHGFRIQALLPTTTADLKTVNRKGQHISLDGRPISCRGALKQILTAFKAYLRFGLGVDNSGLSDPLLCMRISAPAADYDINIEPAKDDVLFAHPEEFRACAEKVFEKVYGKLPKSPEIEECSNVRTHGEDLQTLLHDKPPTGRTKGEDSSPLKAAHITNPWTMAKLTAPIRMHSSSPSKAHLPSPERSYGALSPFEGSAGNRSNDRTPRNSSPSLDESSIELGGAQCGSSPALFPYPSTARRRQQNENQHGDEEFGLHSVKTRLDSWVQRSSEPIHPLSGCRTPTGQPDSGLFVSAASLDHGTPLSSIPVAQPARRRKSSPRKRDEHSSVRENPERLWFGRMPSTCSAPSASPAPPSYHANSIVKTALLRPNREEPDASCQRSITTLDNVHPDLALTLDYERRKTEAVKRHKLHLTKQTKEAALANLAQLSSSPPLLSTPSSSRFRPSPHQNRYEKAVAFLRKCEPTSSGAFALTQSALQSQDPRYYLIQSLADSGYETPSKGVQTHKLPLETISREYSTRELLLLVKSTDIVNDSYMHLLAYSEPSIWDGTGDTSGFTAMSRDGDGSRYAERWSVAVIKLVKNNIPAAADIELQHKIQEVLKHTLTCLDGN